MKAGMAALHSAQTGVAELVLDWRTLAEPLLWTGGGLAAYALSLLSWLAVLVRYPLSFAYPFLSLSYVLVYIGATHWPRLVETATPLRTAGTLLILAGVGLVSITAGRKDDESVQLRGRGEA